MIDAESGQAPALRRVFLLGDATLRPEGMERALVRAGYQVLEAEFPGASTPDGVLPDLVLLTAVAAGDALRVDLARLAGGAWAGVPVFVVLASADPEGAMAALELGAAEALNAPVHLGELCARVNARLHRRGARGAFEGMPAALRPDELLQALVHRIGAALEPIHCAFILTPPGRAIGRVVAVHGTPEYRDTTVDLGRYPEVVEAVRTGVAVFVADAHTDPRLAEAREGWERRGLSLPIQSVLAIPVALHGRTAGVFHLRRGEADPPLTEEQVAFAEAVTAAAAEVLEAEARRTAAYRALAVGPVHDALTGCGTLDALDRRIREEFERARRYALSFSLILLDVDQLRDLNERLGQAGGDRILADLGRLLQRELRVPDFVSRYGGDEFALVLPETDAAGARRSVARVRERIRATLFDDLAPGDRPRLSAGIVTYPHPSAVQTEDLFALVEAALLRGKAQTDERIGTADVSGA